MPVFLIQNILRFYNTTPHLFEKVYITTRLIVHCPLGVGRVKVMDVITLKN